MHLLRRVERYLETSGTSASRFGREVVRDPRFVHDMRKGRAPRPDTARRVLDWMERQQAELGR